ncbi:MAG TPA: hypothetical protein H9727_07560 [Candidatus Borkfalkia avistercoris]|uniref:Phosphagen kinase C-terminal domain-containing protein n=1 Tax=Candidatus Borkfalkia avistercoris TaxID=2838504 RepID=A0A9D2IEC9_9FIRM|nr:hypothetical protein [Candidatus Borkfalkia avistercoris]
MNNIESTVVSTRIRLARNLADYPFPNRLQSVKQAKEIVRIVAGAASRLRAFKLYYMDEITESVAMSLKDDHLISAELAANKKYGAALIDEGDFEEIGEDRADKISIMINEEDHLREQYIARGLTLNTAYLKLSEIDDSLSKSIRFAYDAKLGYLTACPTNLGTGLRASVMLFLPGLTRMNKMSKLIREISRLGHTVRGVFGEGSAAEGYMYQISNEVTLGVTEDYILSEVQKAVLEIVGLEAQARRSLVEEDYVGVKDCCRRAYGILTNCEKISYGEFIKLISDVKLGAALGFVQVSDASVIDDLIEALRPSNISLLRDGEPSAAERDILRAERCRAVLGENAK